MQPSGPPRAELPALPDPAGPLFAPQRAPRPRSNVVRFMIGLGVVAVLGLLAYERFAAPVEGLEAWTPPAGLARADTPDWLQTLCANRTRELCTRADSARRAEDCVAMRAALHRLRMAELQLKAKAELSARQHWTLVELYEQGRDLCQYEPE